MNENLELELIDDELPFTRATSDDLRVASASFKQLSSAHFPIVSRGRRYLAFISAGPIRCGHLLIVPNDSALSYAALLRHGGPEEREELRSFVGGLRRLLSLVSSESCVLFEHGPSTAGGAIGCSVDSAHLHLLPSRVPIENLLGPDLVWHKIHSVMSVGCIPASDTGYLAVFGSGIGRYAYADPATPSQYFRRRIAAWHGHASEYDWRSNPRSDLLRESHDRLSQAYRLLAGSGTVRYEKLLSRHR